MDNNQSISIESGDFAGLSNLINLDLHRNQISSIESGDYTGLTSLTSLRLDDNPISNSQDVIDFITTLDAYSLDDLSIDDNIYYGNQAAFDIWDAIGGNDLTIFKTGDLFPYDGDRVVDGDDLAVLLANWGPVSPGTRADLYLYPNTMVAVKLNGAELKDWLECSANQFNQIDISSTAPQSLINWDTHRTYNFDVIDGVPYQIDVTQPSKFDNDCAVVDGNENAERITELSFEDAQGVIHTGEDLAAMEFIVATNNYRAFGGKFAGTGPEHVVLELPDENRDVLAQYITAQTEAHGQVNTAADHNWSFKTIDTATALDIRFETQDTDKAATFINETKQRAMTKVSVDELGFAVYQIDLTVEPTTK